MQIGVGLPAMIPGAGPEHILGWAMQAEESGFAGLGVLDRIVYGNYEPLITLASAAAVTSRIRLTTTVLLGATRGSGAVLAKQAATLQRMAGGRLTLGLAVGGREDDYTATGTSFRSRGRDLDALIGSLRDVWQGGTGAGAGPIGPPLPDGAPPLLIGGHSDAAMRRSARHAQGWISGSGSAEPFADRLARLHHAWREEGRADRPRVVALAYFALGAGAVASVERYLGACYSGTGPYLRRVVAEALTTPQAVASAAAAHAAAGCDELILLPCDADLRQLTLLTEALRDRLEIL
ncbi:LLM class flavin-dependent oxidoreductase [Streptomyces morookaense]|uniref:LLM class flavin-dependent oxidoreductase n=2 Tax=Streptomyces morookaense TaxID=1970 RepID=A0A7Y7E8C1_STRMO|nr:LLM class flavin-dependent oxidoreductase [Streptomyces morookaense]NVK79142.1 LLM class flavin-dependent oxidoreductase [Streptomyces morookaense]GHF28229.1 monooxygenase [Streptomyces morookaense]